MKQNVKNIVIIIVFVLFITLPVFTLRLTGGDYSEAEKRILAKLPSILTSDGKINPSLGSDTKNWFEDHIGFRSDMVNMYGMIKFNLLNQSPSDQVHIGKDGWYYYTPDENLQIATGDYTLTDEILAQILENHLRIRDKLAERGIEYFIVMPTSKVSIYPEYMRYGNGDIRETPVDIVADYLEANSDLRVVRLKDALLNAKENTQVFLKNDTHWNQEGAYVAYREIISKMNEWGLCEDEPIDVEFEDALYTGEFGAMMGINLPPESTRNSVLPYQNAVKNPQTDRHFLFRDVLSSEEILAPCNYYSNSMVNGPKVMMYGDSMFGGEWHVRELLAEHFSEFSYVWDRNVRSALLDEMEPDIVIYEITERYLNIFPYQNEQFIQTPFAGDAKIVDHSWKGTTLTATVKNTGSSYWNLADQIKLAVFADGRDTGLRDAITCGQFVYPDDFVTFTISFDERPELLEKGIEITMVQEGIQYFGEKKRVRGEGNNLDAAVVSHAAPTALKKNEVRSFEITVENTGLQAWSEDSMIRLCLWINGQDSGYRAVIPEGVTVMPGETCTFVIRDFSVKETGNALLEIMMVQETVCYFGESAWTEITVS